MIEDVEETKRMEAEKKETAAKRISAPGGPISENFCCRNCHSWKPIEGPSEPWGECTKKHDRMYAQIPETVAGGDAVLWTKPDFACVEWTPGYRQLT